MDDSLKFASDFINKARSMSKNIMLIGDVKTGKSTVIDNLIDTNSNSKTVFKKYLGRYD